MTSSDTPLPCPMCGGKANDTSHHSCDCCGKAYTGEVACIECSCSVRHYDTRAEAIAAWNRRTPPTPATDEREAVARAIEIADAHPSHQQDHAADNMPDDISDWGIYLADAALSALAPYRAAEILAAEANERARVKRIVLAKIDNHIGGIETSMVADYKRASAQADIDWLDDIKTDIADAIEHGDHMEEGK